MQQKGLESESREAAKPFPAQLIWVLLLLDWQPILMRALNSKEKTARRNQVSEKASRKKGIDKISIMTHKLHCPKSD